MLLGLVDLIFIKGKHEKDDDLMDILVATFLGYSIITFGPTAYVNFEIVIKEMTMNQLAWRAS